MWDMAVSCYSLEITCIKQKIKKFGNCCIGDWATTFQTHCWGKAMVLSQICHNPWPKAKYSSTGPENVGQWQEPFPEDSQEQLPMQLPSLHLLPRTWLTACKLAATQKAEGKTGFLLDTHICPHMCSLLQTIMLLFLNSHMS